jgi:glycine/D-amino acid oxidase-like deaminating enzyme
MLHCGALSSKGRVLSASSPDGALKGDTKGEWTKLPKVEAGRDPQRKRATGVPDDLDWFVQENITSYNSMGDPTTTAQVHPYEFTTSMASLAQDKGVEVVLGKVTSISSSSEKVETVTYQDKRTSQTHTIPATDVIVSAGPWTSHILRDAPISAMRAHSVTIRATVSPYAIFSEISLPRDFTAGSGSGATRSSSQHPKFVSPEMYARPNNEVYACGEGDTLVPLPASSDLVETSERACQDIIDYVGSISDELRGGEVLVRQACYLPAVEGANGPLIGKTKIEGLFLAAGHTCWGIQNSAATGLLMSEFVWEGKARSAAVGSLDPRSAF